ncbi:MAG: amino acid permease [Kiritimatiellae bacterium]|nr:amino acid permease [Kiritimatiellia bacterium]
MAENSGNKFGTFGGVFTPSILTILGAIMFLRANFIIGHAGVIGALLILVIAKSITGLTSLSVSAVSTNMEVRGGGAYFMISRVLGPQFGGAIGVALFFAQALSVPFYILAFTEALISSFPALASYSFLIMMTAAALLFIVSYVGTSWAIKAQYLIMGILILSIIAFMGGGLKVFSTETFVSNLAPSGDPSYSFWVVFAIYFPAVTGILAGINMSGDLANPTKSIPRGTFWAIGVGFVIYMIQMVISGGAYDRSALIDDPYGVLKDGALFGAGFLVAAGVVAATLSSALGSYLGAPRILQALAKDKILPAIGFFAKGSSDTDEPRRGLVLTAVITFAVLIFASQAGRHALNIVAPIISMFFLYTYGMINLAAFIEGLGKNPSFRPRFKLFHWTTALLGAFGCIAATLLINVTAAIVSGVLMALLYWYINSRRLQAGFGDARRGYVYKAAIRNLLLLSDMDEDSRNWRPATLVFSGNPNSRELLVRYAGWLEGGHGIVYMANVLIGSIEEYAPHRKMAIKQMKNFCKENDISAFPVVAVADSVSQGMVMLMQTASQGSISPNLAVFGWSGGGAALVDYLGHLKIAKSLDMSLVLLAASSLPVPGRDKRIDIWWRGESNGGLMVLLAYMLVQNKGWLRAQIRILRLVQSEAGREPSEETLSDLIQDARVDAVPEVIVDTRPFPELLHENSADATCALVGFELPDEDKGADWFAYQQEVIKDMPTVIFVNSSGQEDLMA